MSYPGRAPHVGVVIPIYCSTEQHETFLEEALWSVARQTFRDFEVILVDDVSPRDIEPIVSRIDGLPNMRIIRNETNLGHARSRNVGVTSTNAELVAFLDHDDTWEPEKLQKQVDEFARTPDAGMVFCRVNMIGSHAHRLQLGQSSIPARPTVMWFLYHGNFVITASAAMVRRSILVEIGLFDPRYTTSDDFDAWLKIGRKHPIVYIDEALASYRLHTLNVNYSVDRWVDSSLLIRQYLNYWRESGLKIKIRLLPKLARKFVGLAYYFMARRQRTKD